MLIHDDNKRSIILSAWGAGMREFVIILKNGTGSGKTEIHIASSASMYQTWVVQTPVALHETDETFTFLMGDWDGDGIADLWAIKRRGTPNGKTEVHIWSGASHFQTKIFGAPTALEATDDSFSFAICPAPSGRPDLGIIKRAGTGQGMTEVHILSAVSNFTQFRTQVVTALHETGTDKNWNFAFADTTKDGKPDLMIMSAVNGGELHCLRGPNYTQFTTHEPLGTDDKIKTCIGMTDEQAAVFEAVVATSLVMMGLMPGALERRIAAVTIGLGIFEIVRNFRKVYCLGRESDSADAPVEHGHADHGLDGSGLYNDDVNDDGGDDGGGDGGDDGGGDGGDDGDLGPADVDFDFTLPSPPG